MNRYDDYHVEDFVLEASFQQWVRYGAAELSLFWERYIINNPGQTKDIETARLLLGGIYAQADEQITDSEMEAEIAGLIQRVRAEKVLSLDAENEIEEEQPLAAPKIRRIWWMSAAATLLIGGLLYMNLSNRDLVKPIGFTQPAGAKEIEKFNDSKSDQQVKLADGSVVVLRPNAHLTMPEQFDNDKRLVHLSGEAYFEIHKDVNRPFLVYTENLVTRVLGTSFIVRAIRNSKQASVEVREGKVSVFKKGDFEGIGSGHTSKGIVLNPNQKILFLQEAGTLVKSLVDVPEIVHTTSKMNFLYRNTPVKDALNDIEKAYQVDIIFDAEMLSECTFTASLSNQTLLEKIAIICETIEAKYEVLDGQVIIYGKNCQN